ncbi:hypothetical protein QR685DRAFT_223074 [Neurospora intermedia]|uniref:Uncharacterized protein n=1 Tax=Neurospora intermedia TaxID=5142 RepID=A0ABR3DH65_NEUIN
MSGQTKLAALSRVAPTRFEFLDDDSDSNDIDQPLSASHAATGLGISARASGHKTVPVQPPPRNPRRLTAVQQKQTLNTSSIYWEISPPLAPHDPKQPSTLASHYFQRYRGGEEISPPSSPEPSYTQPHHRPPILPTGDVSPIEEEYEETAQGASEPQPYGRTQHPHYQGPGSHSPPSKHNAAASINVMPRGQRRLSDAALRNTHVNRAPPSRQPRAPGPGLPLFDPVTGEHLDSAHGRPLNRPPPGAPHGPNPRSARQPPPPPPPPPFAGPQPKMASARDRMMRMMSASPRESGPDPAAGAFAANRPGWRGPSGRTAIVDPVRGPPKVPPLRIPDRDGRRVVSQDSGPSQRPELSLGIPRRNQISPPARAGAPMGFAPRDPGQRVISSSQVHPQSATTPRPLRSPIYPSPPYFAITSRGDAPFVAAQQLKRDGMGPPPPMALTPVSPTNTSPVNSSPQSSQPNPVQRKPTSSYANHQSQDSFSSVYSQQQPEVPRPKQQPPTPQPVAANPLPADEPCIKPPSRFSVTTYATSISTITHAPRESLDDFHDNSDYQPSISSISQRRRSESPKDEEPVQSTMNRSRPKLEGFDYKKNQVPIVVSLKDQIVSPYESVIDRESPAARDRRVGIANGFKPTPRRVSATPSDINKSLPPAPPELEALSLHDGKPSSPKDLTASKRVALYDAQIQALGNRRINITRSIKQMTELMPTDNILNSEAVRRKREIEKQKVEGLKTELAEVQRQMYELGLKLHRAYKRQEKEATFEPTTLWVRRVTG